MRRLLRSVVWAAVLFGGLAQAGTTVYVWNGAPGPAHDGTSWATAFLTVTQGINAAAAGSEVWVGPGTYSELITLKEGVGLYGSIPAYSATRATRNLNPPTSILDGGGAGIVVTISYLSSATRIDGFTIRNAGQSNVGVSCYVSGAVVANNEIKGNGFGLRVAGNGFLNVGEGVSVIGNLIHHNATGLSSDLASNLTITNNTLTDNSYCGIMLNGSWIASAANNIVAFNTSLGIYDVYNNGTWDYNCVYQNTSNYNGVVPVPPHDVAADPIFINRAANDYHIAPTSPCRDAGSDAVVGVGWVDMDNQARILGTHVDIGADEVYAVILTDVATATVPEGGTATFQVKLAAPIASNVTVTVARTGGNSGISVQSGGTLTFTSANWSTYQTLTLAASGDASPVNGTATITGSAAGWTSAAVTASVQPVNDPPVANAQSVTTAEDTAKAITLTGDDGDWDVTQTLTFAIGTGPTHGALSGFNSATGAVTYTPTGNYNGPDSFTFTVTDDASAGAPANLTSPAATVSITVTAVNDPPTANAQSVTTAEDTAKAITLTGADGDPEVAQTLTFSIVNSPTHGALSGFNSATGAVTYTPAGDYNGPDSFTFSVTDDASAGAPANLTSAAATVSITVTAVNDQPTANAQSVTTAEDTAKAITLTGADGDPEVAQTLTFSIVNSPTHGALSGFNSATGAVTYTPAGDYNGPDSFTFTVTDDASAGAPANLTSAAATVSITVTAVNDQPTANAQSVTTAEDTAKAITLTGADGDPEVVQTLTFAIGTGPTHGALSGFNSATGAVTYTPAGDYNGPDSFTFTVTDDASAGARANLTSPAATVSITVTPVNDAPVARAGPDQVVEQASAAGKQVTLDASASSDVDGDALTYTWREGAAVVAGPTTNPVVQVTLALGAHTLTLTADDGHGATGTDDVVVTVRDTTAPSLTIPVNERNPVIEQTSRNGTPFTFHITFSDICDVNPQLTTNVRPTYPLGQTVVTFTVTDATGNSTTQTATVTVVDTTPPVLVAPPDVQVTQGQPVNLGQPTVLDLCDAQPTVTNNAPGTFPLGTTTVTWKATDASGNQATDTQSVTVLAANDTTPPVIQSAWATPGSLTPADHRMVAVAVGAVVVDNVDPTPTWRILSVKSNEAVSGLGAGDLAPDWQITGDHTLNLRAECSPVSLGRVYTITIEARDASGNTSTGTVRVTVPRTR